MTDTTGDSPLVSTNISTSTTQEAPSDPASRKNAAATLQKLSTHPEFKVTWTNRRRIINIALMFCAWLVVIIMFLCGMSMWYNRDIQPNISSIFITMISTTFLFASALIGSYVFGISYDTNNVRSRLTDLATTVANK